MTRYEFETFVIPMTGSLLSYAERFTESEDEARDLVQEVLTRLWEKRKSLNEVTNLRSYVFRIARNLAIDYHRTPKHKKIDDEPNGTWESKNASDDYDTTDAAQMVKQIISNMPTNLREVIWLRDICQFSTEETAEVTGLNDNQVRVSLSRARKQVRNIMLALHQYELKTN